MSSFPPNPQGLTGFGGKPDDLYMRLDEAHLFEEKIMILDMHETASFLLYIKQTCELPQKVLQNTITKVTKCRTF